MSQFKEVLKLFADTRNLFYYQKDRMGITVSNSATHFSLNIGAEC